MVTFSALIPRANNSNEDVVLRFPLDNTVNPEPQIRHNVPFALSNAPAVVQSVVRFTVHCQHAIDEIMDNIEVLSGKEATEEDEVIHEEAIREFRIAYNAFLHKFLSADYTVQSGEI